MATNVSIQNFVPHCLLLDLGTLDGLSGRDVTHRGPRFGIYGQASGVPGPPPPPMVWSVGVGGGGVGVCGNGRGAEPLELPLDGGVVSGGRPGLTRKPFASRIPYNVAQ